jgi:hypothetical protein
MSFMRDLSRSQADFLYCSETAFHVDYKFDANETASIVQYLFFFNLDSYLFCVQKYIL